MSVLSADLLCDKSWKMVSAGSDHTLALDQFGYLFAWGNNNYGQLGSADHTQTYTPHQVLVEMTFKFVAAKNHTSFAISSDGHLYAWGRNDFYQLGLGDSGSSKVYSPQRVGFLNSWVAVAPGAFHALGLTSFGHLYVWGVVPTGVIGSGSWASEATPKQILSNNTWKSISASEHQSFAINTNGSLFAWGANTFGQLGDGTTIGHFIPVHISHPQGISWKTVAAGAYHTLAIDANDFLYAWGRNYNGQLGDNSFDDKIRPTQISSSGWKTITAGTYYSAGINKLGFLYTWGLNHKGQLGVSYPIERNTPQLVDSESKYWTTISAGDGHTVAILSNSQEIISWGENTAGQLGIDTPYSRSSVQYCPSNSGGSVGYTKSNSTYRYVPYTSSYTSGSTVLVVMVHIVVFIVFFGCIFIFARLKQQQSQQRVQEYAQLVSLSGGQSNVQTHFIAHQNQVGPEMSEEI